MPSYQSSIIAATVRIGIRLPLNGFGILLSAACTMSQQAGTSTRREATTASQKMTKFSACHRHEMPSPSLSVAIMSAGKSI
ncbi:MAG: hypothetical protein LUB57_01875 [Cloacibacillus porcorum]|nr:hypothetical protein [Cloacibacillus porcorum]